MLLLKRLLTSSSSTTAFTSSLLAASIALVGSSCQESPLGIGKNRGDDATLETPAEGDTTVGVGSETTETPASGAEDSGTIINSKLSATALEKLTSRVTFSINNGAEYTNSSGVTLNIDQQANSFAHMYITNTADCKDGGEWQVFADKVSGWVLGSANTTVTVYARFRDAVGRLTDCVSDSIIHDDTPPAAPTITGTLHPTNFKPHFTWTSGEGGVGTFRTRFNGGDLSEPTTDLSLTVSGLEVTKTYTLEVQEEDAAGNWSSFARADSAPVVSVGAGETFTCVLLANGRVKCVGAPTSSQLGRPSTPFYYFPHTVETAVDLGTGAKATALSVGWTHSCVILDSGAVKCWGSGAGGKLGYGSLNNKGTAGTMGDDLPTVDLGTGRTAKAISAGLSHTCAILDNDSVKCWGGNTMTGLGLSSGASGDAAGEMGDALPTVDLGTGRTARAIAAKHHTCVILDTGAVKCWGNNGKGQLGLGDTTNRGTSASHMGDNLPIVDLGTGRTATAIETAYQSNLSNGFTCAILDNGAAKCWGYGGQGNLGYGDTANRGDGAGEMGDNLPAINVGSGRTATAIAVGGGGSTATYSRTCMSLDNGSLKCFGYNGAVSTWGLLGLGTKTSYTTSIPADMPSVDLGTDRRARQVSIGLQHNCAVLDDSSLKCWGINNSFVLGYGAYYIGTLSADEVANSSAVNLGTGRTPTSMSRSSTSACAVVDTGEVKCWGNGINGQMGNDSTNSQIIMGDSLPSVSLGQDATKVSVGGDNVCALLADGSLKCWGYNYAGSLGIGDTNARGNDAGEMAALPAVNLGDTAIDVKTSGNFTCAVTSAGVVKCMGQSLYGALGQGNTSSYSSPVTVSLNGTATKIAVNGYSACALLSGGSVKCWGYNAGGIAGQGHTNHIGDGANEMGANLPAIDLDATATDIVMGGSHVCALLSGGSVKCWGSGSDSGLGDSTSRGDGAGEMGSNLPAVDLGTGRTVTQLSAYSSSTCALLDNGTVKCWGSNNSGELGLGDTATRGDGPGEMGDALPAIDFGPGATVTELYQLCAKLSTGTVKCWGPGSEGTLGQGSASRWKHYLGDEALEMGDYLDRVRLY